MPTVQEKYYEEGRGRDLRRVDPSIPRNHWIANEMWELHHEIARRVVLGEKNVDIAAILNISAQAVCNVRNSPVVQEKIALMRGARDADTIDLSKEIKEIAPDALKLLKEIIRGEGDGKAASINLRAREANGMLARIGHGIPHRVQSENVHAFITSEELRAIKQRAITNGDVVDVEVVG